MNNAQISKQIADWIREKREEKWDSDITAIEQTFGIVTLEDGREAQIQVKIEADSEEWWRSD